MAEEIKRKSQEISADCIDEKMHTTSSLIDRVFIKQHMQMNSTCLKLQFQGTRATKLFMGWYSISILELDRVNRVNWVLKVIGLYFRN